MCQVPSSSSSSDAHLGCHGVSQVSELSFPGSYVNSDVNLRLWPSFAEFLCIELFCVFDSGHGDVAF